MILLKKTKVEKNNRSNLTGKNTDPYLLLKNHRVLTTHPSYRIIDNIDKRKNNTIFV